MSRLSLIIALSGARSVRADNSGVVFALTVAMALCVSIVALIACFVVAYAAHKVRIGQLVADEELKRASCSAAPGDLRGGDAAAVNVDLDVDAGFVVDIGNAPAPSPPNAAAVVVAAE
jgi:hypothetical protein